MLDPRVNKVQEELFALEANRDLATAKSTIRTMVELILPDLQANPEDLFRIYNDKDGKLKANAGWFQADEVIADRLAVYAMDLPSDANLDVKVFGVNKANKGTISWAVGLTPNFEDEPFNGRFNVGIDFFVPKSMDRVIVALSKNYVIRTIQFSGSLTATFQSILGKWAQIGDTTRKAELHNLLWESLDLQPINKKFYEGISQRFSRLRQHLVLSKFFDDHDAAQFANRLIGRLIFVWFLDKKSLLSKDENYFEPKSFESESDYYRIKLKSLFFDVLNTPVNDRIVKDRTTPYLNGGLFEPKSGENDRLLQGFFPEKYFADIYDFLNSYNFTTDESTSEFQQVAIDPEMLGRIFENLLAEVSEDSGEQARKAKGAFYTPREIVDSMCKDALKSYLKNKLPEDTHRATRIYQLIDATEREFQDQDHNWRRDLAPYKADILRALDGLRVLDPACGSGAFPIGMLQLLVKVYSRLEPRFDSHKAKLAIVEKNIFGVDIEPMAIEISRLRAWLALVVDDEEVGVKPLPNLDFKFIAANSLIPLEDKGQLAFFEDADLDLKIQEIREKFFRTDNQKTKAGHKRNYAKLVDQELSIFGESPRTSQLRTFRPFESDSVAEFFDAEFMFGFEKFEIVIGNPPYVRQEKIKYKEKLKVYEIFQSTADLYTYFYELAVKLLVDGGVASYITSSKFGRALYGENLRNLLSKKTAIEKIVDFGTKHVFAAVTNTWVVQFRNESALSGHEFSVSDGLTGDNLHIKQQDLTHSSWAFTDGATAKALSAISSSGVMLADLNYKICYGLKTGCNEGFVIERSDKEAFEKSNVRNLEVVKPLLRGRDIGRYSISEVSTWILATKNGQDIEKDYPDIARFLESRDEALNGKLRARGDQGNHWMNLRDCTYYGEMEGEKIVWLELSDNNKFALSLNGEYILAGAWMIVGPDLKVLLAILNSKVIKFYFDHISNSSGMGTTQWKKFAVERLPIPVLEDSNPETKNEITSLVDRRNLLAVTGDQQEIRLVESKIDELVFKLYDLTNEDLAVIQTHT